MGAVSGIKRFFGFIGEVKNEVEKISWPGKQEIIITTVVVFILALLASVFFSVVDTVIYRIVHSVVGR
ncbi:MAG: preprotein translocase subunit SecE [Holosporales bacterium]|jgi:preprotein translocase subunit SecE|nr:preprotein translocase subunit SecE [Holosporales bacterium]